MKELRALLLFVMLLLFGGMASAQTAPAPAPAASAPVPYRCIPVFGCFDGFEGLSYETGTVGRHLWWYKQRLGTDGKVITYADGLACRHAMCNIQAFGAWMLANFESPEVFDRELRAQQKLAELGPLDCVAEKPLCDEHKALVDAGRPMAEAFFALKRAPLPPPPAASAPTPVPGDPVWIVTPSGTATDRPAYPVVNGKRATLSDARAKVNATCNCVTFKVLEFGITTYCAVPDSGLVVPKGSLRVTACMVKK